MIASPSPDRRRAILDAALACFLDQGYLATSIADIRRRSGASTGSIYHFFTSKAALAETLLREAVGGWAAVSGAALSANNEPEDQVKSSVRGLVLWGLSQPAQVRFLDELRGLAVSDADLSGVQRLLMDGHSAGAARYAAMQAQGAVRNLPFAVAHALMLGPAYSYLRLAPPTGPDEAARLADVFAAAAWDAVRAR